MGAARLDLVVVGAGPAGLAAAAEVACRGGTVEVVDEAPNPGGRLPSQIHEVPRSKRTDSDPWSNGDDEARRLAGEALEAGVRVRCGLSVWGVFPGWYVGVSPVDPGIDLPLPPRGLETRSLLIATGATQCPMVVDGWTLPGVITAGAALALVNVYRVLPGHRAVIVGIDPLALSVAQLLAAVGVQVLGVLLPPRNGLQMGPASPRSAIEALARLSGYAPSTRLALTGWVGGQISGLVAKLLSPGGVRLGELPLMLRRTVRKVQGAGRVESVQVTTLRPDGTVVPDSEETWEVDVVITSAGLSPLVELVGLAGCPVLHVPDLGGWVPVHNSRLETPIQGLFVAGSVTGVEGAIVAEAQGRLAGISICSYLGLGKGRELGQELAVRQSQVDAARSQALPFSPNTQAGRIRMAEAWSTTVRE